MTAIANAQFRLQPDTAKLNIHLYRAVIEDPVIVVTNSEENVGGAFLLRDIPDCLTSALVGQI